MGINGNKQPWILFIELDILTLYDYEKSSNPDSAVHPVYRIN